MVKGKKVIRKVWLHKGTNQKIVTIPKDSEIKQGDYVKIEKIE